MQNNWFKKADPTSSAEESVNITQAVINRLDQIPNETIAGCNLGEIKRDLKIKLQEIQKTLAQNRSSKETTTLSVDSIVNATQSAIDRVDQIPDGSFAGYNLEEVKRDLKGGLAAVMERASELAAIINNMQAIRNEIFRPVINETKLANNIARWGLVIAVLALVVTVVTLMSPSRPEVVSKPPGVPPNPPSTAKLNPTDILASVGEAPEQASYTKIRTQANELEGLVSSSKVETSHIARIRNSVIGELKEMQKTGNNDQKTLAVATYALLCAAASYKWDEVSNLASAWLEKDTDSATGYETQIKGYEAEALARRGLIAAATNKYDRLRAEGAKSNEIPFLSPVDFRMTEGTEFAANRLEDLKLQQDFANRAVWIFDMDGNSGTRSAKALTDQGFIGAVAKGTWPGKPYHAPYVYCKERPNHKISEKWKTLVSGIAQMERHPTVQYFAFSSDKTVREQFAANPTLDVIIILPSAGKAVTALLRADGNREGTVN